MKVRCCRRCSLARVTVVWAWPQFAALKAPIAGCVMLRQLQVNPEKSLKLCVVYNIVSVLSVYCKDEDESVLGAAQQS
jgi:hypothetical protein